MPERKHEIDLFVQFLLDERNFRTTSDAGREIGFDPRTLNRASARRIRSLPAMIRWVDIFEIPRERFGLWVEKNIQTLANEADLIDLAS